MSGHVSRDVRNLALLKTYSYYFSIHNVIIMGAIALSYPPRVRVRATAKLSAAFFHDESSVTIGGVRKCNSTIIMM